MCVCVRVCLTRCCNTLLTWWVQYKANEGIHLTPHTLPDGGREVDALTNPDISLAETDEFRIGEEDMRTYMCIQGDIHTQYRYSTCTGGHTYTVQVQYMYRGTYIHSTRTVRIQGEEKLERGVQGKMTRRRGREVGTGIENMYNEVEY